MYKKRKAIPGRHAAAPVLALAAVILLGAAPREAAADCYSRATQKEIQCSRDCVNTYGFGSRAASCGEQCMEQGELDFDSCSVRKSSSDDWDDDGVEFKKAIPIVKNTKCFVKTPRKNGSEWVINGCSYKVMYFYTMKTNGSSSTSCHTGSARPGEQVASLAPYDYMSFKRQCKAGYTCEQAIEEKRWDVCSNGLIAD